MVVLSGVIGHTQLFRVKELTHIAANFPRVIFTRHSTDCAAAARGCQLLLGLLAGFAADINLHGWQVPRWSVTLSLPPVFPTFEPSALPTRIVLFSPV
jgi:hypothetical protein